MSKIGARLNYTIPLTKLANFIVWPHEAVVKKTSSTISSRLMWLKSNLYLLVYGVLVTHFNIALPLCYVNIAA